MTEAMDAKLGLTIEDGVARLTLNRPEVHNAFDGTVISDMTAVLNRLDNDERVRLVVLTANGKSFSAGADLGWMRRMAGYNWRENYEDSLALGKLMWTLNNLQHPTIARINGAAIGGGVGLVACCDVAVAVDNAVFALPEVKLGLIPAVISPYVCNAIGERQARRYFITGEHFGAEVAKGLGLVHEVVGIEDLDRTVEGVVNKLLAGGPQAIRAAKALARDTGRAPISDDMVKHTVLCIADQRAGDEGREGVTAFLEKRKPGWRPKGVNSEVRTVVS